MNETQEDFSKMNIYEKLDEIQWDLLQDKMHKKNGFHGKYIPLEELTLKIKPICRKYGIVYYFTANETHLILKIFDKTSKEQLSPSPHVRLPILTKDMKEEGGNYTYMKRYLLMNTFLVIAESFDPEDTETDVPDDASSATTKKETSQQKREVADLPMGKLVLEAKEKLVKKGLSEKEITYKALKDTILHLKKWSVAERRCILDYFKKKEASK